MSLQDPLSMFQIRGKVALITGASGAFGMVAARAAGETAMPPGGAVLPLALPQDLDALMAQDMVAASALRMQLREALQDRMALGQRIVGFDKQSRCYRLA